MDNLLSSFVLFLIYCTTSSAQLLSIDCGATKPYTDINSIKWVPDDSYVNNGKIYTVKAPDSISEPLKTLRAFTTRKKNCYLIPVQSNAPVLIRASFYYQNYDGKASPPTFELQLDGNKWTTVETRIDEEITYEIIYVVNGYNGTYICVAQSIDGNIPFVSSIQASQLEVGMYANSLGSGTAGLFLHRRVAYGADKAIRYPDDEFDRIWEPSISSDSLSVFSTGVPPDTSNLQDHPPYSVLQTLVTPSGSSTSLPIPLSTNLPSNSANVYFNLYFNEMLNTDILTTRSFEVYMDGKSVIDPISMLSILPVSEYTVSITASGLNKFELMASASSTLSPIISAMEVFSVTEELNNATHSSDLEGIRTLQVKFGDLSYWGGDPCLPKSYGWEWVECNSDSPPRITAIHLGGYGLTGELPDFSLLTALETIDMQKNSISGGIPEFLGELPNLKELNLASNNLSGPVPSSIANNNIKLVIDGNPNVCQSGQSCQTFGTDSPPIYPSSYPDDSTDSPTTVTTNNKQAKNKKKGANLGLIVGLPVPLAVIVLVAVLVTYFLRTRKAPKAAASVGPGPANQQNAHVNGLKNKGKESKEENLEEVFVEVGEETVEEVVEEEQESNVHNV